MHQTLETTKFKSRTTFFFYRVALLSSYMLLMCLLLIRPGADLWSPWLLESSQQISEPCINLNFSTYRLDYSYTTLFHFLLIFYFVLFYIRLVKFGAASSLLPTIQRFKWLSRYYIHASRVENCLIHLATANHVYCHF